MNALRIILIVVLSLVLIGSAGYLYASSGVKSKPGYEQRFATNPLPLDGGEPVKALLVLNLGPSGITPLRWLIKTLADQADQALETSEQILLSLVKEIQGVQLRIYEVRNNRRVFDRAIADSIAELSDKSWQPLVKIRDGDEHIVVMQFGDDQEIAAISVMVSTSENAVFLNLIGPFDPEEIAASVAEVH